MNPPQIEPPNVASLPAARPNCYHVPRRFNLRAIMVLTAVIAGVCGLLQRFDAHPAVYIVLAVMSGIAAAAQILFPQNPRRASAVAGGVVIGGFGSVGFIVETWAFSRLVNEGVLCFLVGGIIAWIVIGLLLGYAFGTLTAGVFMISDWLSPTSMFNNDQNPQPPEKQPR